MSLIWKTQLLWTQCRRIGPHLAERGKSHGFSRLRQDPGLYSRVTRGCPFETGVCSVKSGHLSRNERQLRNIN